MKASGRLSQFVTGLAAIVISWYAMMAIHEAGHFLGALVTGATVEGVKIPLMGFSRTDVSGGAHPLLVVWAGPVLGALFPLLLLPLRGIVRRPVDHVISFFAGFCLVVNGVYLGAGSLVGAGDCNDLLYLGVSVWQLLAFGALASAAGLYIWHRMGALKTWFSPWNTEDRCRRP